MLHTPRKQRFLDIDRETRIQRLLVPNELVLAGDVAVVVVRGLSVATPRSMSMLPH
jgi:hypothetical protein